MKKLYLWIGLGIMVLSVNIAINFAGLYSYHVVYMYNFIKYVDWPEEKKGGNFVIGVLGTSPIFNELTDMAAKRKIGNRNIEVKKVALEEISSCNIAFVPEENIKHISSISGNIKNKGVLLISESPGMSKKGAAINFIFIDGKLKFEINKSAASQANLSISTELIKLGIPIN